MKTISLIICLFAIAVIAMAQSAENLMLEVKKTDQEKTISVNLENLKKKSTEISIMAMDGQSLYSNHISGDLCDAAMTINLGGMKPGNYILKVSNGMEKNYTVFFLTEEEVVLADNKAAISPTSARYGMTPNSKLIASFWVEENSPSQVHVQVSNLMHQPAKVKIFSWEGECLYRAKIADEVGYYHTFDFAKEGLTGNVFFMYVDASEAIVYQAVETQENEVKLGPTMGKERMLLEKTHPAVAVKW